ncbi:carbohydrate deacetylase [Humisphaera borealis]|uniref:ChbG/HpnK family deacetylase n=1 Tax=Humisphaera borealis TaxID=2807512 RepID=A0A7M2WXN3_9BACT|nr:ChbG/HpnK family deacetylase [Humisphaera borealis]QOV90169.1 ChbG/HpnK family deacetylase [Humisphaera borealis]
MVKRLIVNADDFGQSPEINRGILHAHAYGIVTSTSVLVRWPAAAEVTNVVHDYPQLGLGLHVDLGEWACRNGEWYPLYRVLSEAAESSSDAVSAEVMRQLSSFRALTGKNPTHLDSHQHVHRSEPLRSILLDLGQALQIPVRHFSPDIRYVGDFYGQTGTGEPYPEGITVESLRRVIASLADGTNELCCHPGLGVDHDSPYAHERMQECNALCDPTVRHSLDAAQCCLVSFGAPR